MCSLLDFECLNLKGKDKKQQIYQKLYSESVEMMFKFQKLFSSTKKSLRERNITSHEISNHVECLGSLKPALFDDSGLPVFRCQISRLQQTESPTGGRLEEDQHTLLSTTGWRMELCLDWSLEKVTLLQEEVCTTEEWSACACNGMLPWNTSYTHMHTHTHTHTHTHSLWLSW